MLDFDISDLRFESSDESNITYSSDEIDEQIQKLLKSFKRFSAYSSPHLPKDPLYQKKKVAFDEELPALHFKSQFGGPKVRHLFVKFVVEPQKEKGFTVQLYGGLNAVRSYVTKAKPDNKKKYSHTIQLPKTQFPHWMSAAKRIHVDEAILKTCGFDELYSWQRENIPGPEFILHDGPPYANGLPHMGHAINKILKDIINRSKMLSGYKVHFAPGWDCHGLPIELKALDGQIGLDPISIRKKAREFAEKALADQRVVFRMWGLMADWKDNCYYTFDSQYVKNQLQQFFNLYKKKLIYRDMKPVYWSPSSRTALAEAELEYKTDHVSDAITLKLKLVESPFEKYSPLYVLVWTTTPWTLPANEAVAFNPKSNYSIVELDGSFCLLCSNLVGNLRQKLNRNLEELLTFKGELLSDCRYEHPLRGDVKPLLGGQHVTEEAGTGLVHTAPSHGPDDYLLALTHHIPIISYVDEKGCYTSEAGDKLKGLSALDAGSTAVLDMISQDVIFREKFVHSYPYDWRTKRPVMLRACKQWFIDTNALKERAIEVLKEVKIKPERNAAGLLAQIESRPYWCISRQRAWGVPIPILYDMNENPLISEDHIKHYFELIDKRGTDFWWSSSTSDLVPSSMDGSGVTKSSDILDIWLDSGLSWSAVLGERRADLYLEGIDQFTGWFQSSLLTSVALRDRAPYKAILAHGFAVDDEGRKMSKSLGNIVSPQDITHGSTGRKREALGVDVLRWWVAGHSLQHANIPISKSTLEDSVTAIKKIRNSLKYLLGAVHDLPVGMGPPPLRYIDQYILIKLHDLLSKSDSLYENYEFNKICLMVLNFVANELSSLYCTVTKDRLYCDAGDSRQAVQFTMNEIIYGLLKIVGPILPVMTEEAFSHHPHNTVQEPFFYRNWRKIYVPEKEEFIMSMLSAALSVKDELLKEKPVNVELAKLSCTLSVGGKLWSNLKMLQPSETSLDSELVEILSVSEVTLHKSDNEETDLKINWSLSSHHKCERCWKYNASSPNSLCHRCSHLLNS